MAAIEIGIPNNYASPDFGHGHTHSHNDHGHSHNGSSHSHGHSHGNHSHSHGGYSNPLLAGAGYQGYNQPINMHQHDDGYKSHDGYSAKNKSKSAVVRTIRFCLSFSADLFGLLFDSGDSRNLMLFFLINFTFAFVELIVGYWSNSLSLQSDAWHMFNDSMATFYACCAMVMNKWPKSKNYSFGYKRVNVLFAFVNCLFLLKIGFGIFNKAIHRIVHPEEMDHEHLLWVSIAGLLVNLLGVFAFSHAHNHSHGPGGCPHSGGGGGGHGHGHSHGDHGHGHSHGGGGSGSRNVLIDSVLFHTLVDTGGSVAVIISGRLDHWYGWRRADPICSLILSIMIIYTVKDVVMETFLQLLQGTSDSLYQNGRQARNSVMHELQAQGIRECKEKKIWCLNDSQNYGTVTCLGVGVGKLSSLEF